MISGRAVAGAAFATLLLLVAGCRTSPQAAREELLVFAAASLEDALFEVGEAFEASSGGRVVFNFAGTNVLARQILAGAAADIFVSADVRWMDEVEAAGRLVESARREVLSNRLVVVAHPNAEFSMRSLADLAELDFRYLSLGDPDSVPAGRYARSLLGEVQLEDGSLWSLVSSRVVPAPDVRAALGLVREEPRAVGIVYRSDVEAQSGVEVLWEIAQQPRPPVRYVAAVVGSGGQPSPRARAFLEFLSGPEAARIFDRYGFETLTWVRSSPP